MTTSLRPRAASPRPAPVPVPVLVEPVRRPPGEGTFIGNCYVCGHLVPYGSGWVLIVAHAGSRLSCGPQQQHRPAEIVYPS